MANMSAGDRNSFERATTGNEHLLRPRDGSKRAVNIFLVIGIVVLAALSYAAIERYHGWDHLIVIGDVALVVAALGAFLYRKPENRLEG